MKAKTPNCNEGPPSAGAPGSATPRTDAAESDIIGFFSGATVPAGFARKLEREAISWRQCAEKLHVFAIHYSAHPKRNPDDKLDETLALYDSLMSPNDKLSDGGRKTL